MSGRVTGTILDEKYEIVRRLGSGGMGEVYLVRHIHLQELRVVKILRQDLAADPVAQKRFVREARLATQIKHANVAILYDFSRLPDGSFYMVWEHIEGQDVGDCIRRRGPFPVRLGIRLGIQALRGLEAIHAAGIIHRDVSPDNLMIMENVRKQPWLKIIDLGLAKNLAGDGTLEITQVGMFMGKLQYCSPEQAGAAEGIVLDRRSDLYSFALVLFEMMTGLPAFDSENQHGFVLKRLTEDPLSLIGRNPNVDVPLELDRVMQRALKRDREERFPDGITFIQALERVERSLEGVDTREVTMPPELRRPPDPEAKRRSSHELSREERLDLLAQIERAGKKSPASSTPGPVRSAAPSTPPPGAAIVALIPIPASVPLSTVSAASVPQLPLAPSPEVRQRVAETEKVLNKYIQNKQLPLARLALETLLELAPSHPNRGDYENWVNLLGSELEQDKRADVSIAAARAAVGRRDFRTARTELTSVTRNDLSGRRSEALTEEIDRAERDQKAGVEEEDRRKRLSQFLDQRKPVEAEQELNELARLGLPRVTLDAYRERLDEVKNAAEHDRLLAPLEKRYRDHLQMRNWFAARDVALELERNLPASPRAAVMYGEVERLEMIHKKQQAVEEAVVQIDSFIDKGDLRQGELAFRILLQLDPENRHRKRFEKQLKNLSKASR
jgi:serine/threonine protein kinase